MNYRPLHRVGYAGKYHESDAVIAFRDGDEAIRDRLIEVGAIAEAPGEKATFVPAPKGEKPRKASRAAAAASVTSSPAAPSGEANVDDPAVVIGDGSGVTLPPADDQPKSDGPAEPKPLADQSLNELAATAKAEKVARWGLIKGDADKLRAAIEAHRALVKG